MRRVLRVPCGPPPASTASPCVPCVPCVPPRPRVPRIPPCQRDHTRLRPIRGPFRGLSNVSNPAGNFAVRRLQASEAGQKSDAQSPQGSHHHSKALKHRYIRQISIVISVRFGSFCALRVPEHRLGGGRLGLNDPSGSARR